MANVTQSQEPLQTRSPRTNIWAIASLTCGVLWMFCVGSALAIVFGLIALWQIKRTGDAGKRLAIAGIMLGFVVPSVLIAVFVAAGGIRESSDSVCAKVGVHVAEAPGEPALVQVEGYQYANIPGPGEQGQTGGRIELKEAQAFAGSQNDALPGVITGSSAHFVVTVPPGTPALQTVCSDKPPVLSEFQLGTQNPPGLQYWTEAVWTGWTGTPSATSETSISGVLVAAKQEPLNIGQGYRYHYVWLDRGILFWVFGNDQQTVEHFVEELIRAS